MRIKVQDLGTIKEGEFSTDKPLTVLVGPNNSGKSYLTYLLHGIMTDPSLLNGINSKLDITSYDIPRKNGIIDINKDKIIPIIKKNQEAIVEYIKQLDGTQISKYFLSNQVSGQFSILNTEDLLTELYAQIIYEFSENKQFINLAVGEYKARLDLDKVPDELNITRFIVDVSIKNILLKRCISFPAERLALTMLGGNEVERKAQQQDKIQQLVLEGKTSEIGRLVKETNQFKPRYPQAINDYIYFVNNLKNIVQEEGEFADFANEIQNMLLEGQVGVSEFGNINYIPKNSNKALEIHVSSSLVKSLSGLILYFRHAAKKGDTIIIDEPEVNLHPNNQRIVARVLAKAVNLGFKIIISTHSDYIIRELNNLIMLSKAAKDESTQTQLLQDLSDQGYDKTTYLNPEDVGVYFCNNNKVQELEVDQQGFEVSTIDEETDRLNYASEQIYYSLFDETT